MSSPMRRGLTLFVLIEIPVNLRSRNEFPDEKGIDTMKPSPL